MNVNTLAFLYPNFNITGKLYQSDHEFCFAENFVIKQHMGFQSTALKLDYYQADIIWYFSCRQGGVSEL